MAESHERPAVMLVLHDMAPSTWADYRGFVDAVDRLGNVPMTWLVVSATAILTPKRLLKIVRYRSRFMGAFPSAREDQKAVLSESQY